MICLKCGGQVLESDKFCTYCGAKLERTIETPTEPSVDNTAAPVSKPAASAEQSKAQAESNTQTNRTSENNPYPSYSSTNPFPNHNSTSQNHSNPNNPYPNYTSPSNNYNPYENPYQQQAKPSAKATAALVLGIISVVTNLYGGFIIGLVAIILGLIGYNENKRKNLPTGTAIVGIVLGIIGVFVSIIYALYIITMIKELLDIFSKITYNFLIIKCNKNLYFMQILINTII